MKIFTVQSMNQMYFEPVALVLVLEINLRFNQCRHACVYIGNQEVRQLAVYCYIITEH